MALVLYTGILTAHRDWATALQCPPLVPEISTAAPSSVRLWRDAAAAAAAGPSNNALAISSTAGSSSSSSAYEFVVPLAPCAEQGLVSASRDRSLLLWKRQHQQTANQKKAEAARRTQHQSAIAKYVSKNKKIVSTLPFLSSDVEIAASVALSRCAIVDEEGEDVPTCTAVANLANGGGGGGSPAKKPYHQHHLTTTHLHSSSAATSECGVGCVSGGMSLDDRHSCNTSIATTHRGAPTACTDDGTASIYSLGSSTLAVLDDALVAGNRMELHSGFVSDIAVSTRVYAMAAAAEAGGLRYRLPHPTPVVVAAASIAEEAISSGNAATNNGNVTAKPASASSLSSFTVSSNSNNGGAGGGSPTTATNGVGSVPPPTLLSAAAAPFQPKRCSASTAGALGAAAVPAASVSPYPHPSELYYLVASASWDKSVRITHVTLSSTSSKKSAPPLVAGKHRKRQQQEDDAPPLPSSATSCVSGRTNAVDGGTVAAVDGGDGMSHVPVAVEWVDDVAGAKKQGGGGGGGGDGVVKNVSSNSNSNADANEPEQLRLSHPLVEYRPLSKAISAEKKLLGHTHDVLSVAFSPCDNLVASAGRDCTIRLWSVATGECLWVSKGKGGGSAAAAASASSYASILLSRGSAVSGSLASHESATDHTDWVSAVRFSPKIISTTTTTNAASNTTTIRKVFALVSASWDGTVRVWSVVYNAQYNGNASSGSVNTATKNSINNTTNTNTNTTAAQGNGNNTINANTNNTNTTNNTNATNASAPLHHHHQLPTREAITSAKTAFIYKGHSGGGGGSVPRNRAGAAAATAASSAPTPTPAPTTPVTAITISPDGSLCASGAKDGMVHLWDLAGAVESKAFAHLSASSASSPTATATTASSTAALSSSSSSAAVAPPMLSAKDVLCFTLDTIEGRGAGGAPLETAAASSSASPNPPAAASASASATAAVTQLVFSPRYYWLTVATEGGILRIYNLEKASSLADLVPETMQQGSIVRRRPTCTSVCWSRDGGVLYSGYTDNTIRVWRAHRKED